LKKIFFLINSNGNLIIHCSIKTILLFYFFEKKLPCHSGKKLEILESDPLILQIVNSIIDLSRFKLSTIANNLTQLLETISKVLNFFFSLVNLMSKFIYEFQFIIIFFSSELIFLVIIFVK